MSWRARRRKRLPSLWAVVSGDAFWSGNFVKTGMKQMEMVEMVVTLVVVMMLVMTYGVEIDGYLLPHAPLLITEETRGYTPTCPTVIRLQAAGPPFLL